jgi:hypothetical protein
VCGRAPLAVGFVAKIDTTQAVGDSYKWARSFDTTDRGSSIGGISGDEAGNMYATVTTSTCCSAEPELDGYGRPTGRFASIKKRSIWKLSEVSFYVRPIPVRDRTVYFMR